MTTRTTQNSTRLLQKLGGAATLVIGLWLASPATADNPPWPGLAPALGGFQLAFWEDIYWRWAYGGLTIPPDANGNATVGGHVVLLAIPSTPGDGTPGSLDLTLKADQAFMLPLWGQLGTSYTDGTPPDPFIDVNVFKTLQLKLTIDGVTIVDGHNLMRHYSQFLFRPPISINSPPYQAIIWFQGVGIFHEPLKAGKHVIKLDVKNTQDLPPNFGGGVVEYHNTWNVTVKCER